MWTTAKQLERTPVATTTAVTAPIGANDLLTRLVVLITVYLAGLHLSVAGGVPAALLIIVGLIPMWWRTVGQMEFVRVIVALAFASLAAGFYLADASSIDHEISRSGQRQFIVLLLGGLAVTIAVLWGRQIFPLHVVAVAYGLGDVTNAMLFTSQSWKYFLALPATIVIVGFLGRYPRRAPAVIALLLLGVVTALDRGRSFFAFCVLAACMVAWQSLGPTNRETRRWQPALLLAGAGVATYQLAIAFLTRGFLGEAAQQRTVDQIETSGSLLLGGRPQWAATRALASERPWGYGLGVLPNSRDYGLVTSGFQSLNLFDADGYIRNSMLLGQFRLHSITLDLWARCGVIGVVLALVIGYALVRSLSSLIAARACPPIVALMAILSVWYLAFEPSFSYSRDVFFALGITLLPKLRTSSSHATKHTRPELSDV